MLGANDRMASHFREPTRLHQEFLDTARKLGHVEIIAHSSRDIPAHSPRRWWANGETRNAFRRLSRMALIRA
jgi:hypothetical protein